MKRKIFLYCMLIVITASAIMGGISLYFTRNFYLENQEDTIIQQIELISNYINDTPKSDLDYEKTALFYSMNNRVTIINTDGKVLGESEQSAETMENHLQRQEIREAIRNGYGKTVRNSITTGIETMYYAKLMANGNTIIRVAIPIEKLNDYENHLILVGILSLLAGLCAAALLVKRYAEIFLKPLNELSSAVKQVADGKYDKINMIHRDDEIGVLANNYNLMAETIKNGLYILEYKNASINSIVNSVPNSIIAVNTDKKIILVNDEAAKLIDCADNKESVYNIKADQVIRDDGINALMNKSLDDGGTYTDVITLDFSKNKIYAITVTPITSKSLNYECKGCIVVLVDITNVKSLENMRTEFVSNVTHELRTPLTSIRGFVETLKDGAIDDKEVATSFLDIIEEESERLSKLINNILDLNEIENVETSYEREQVNVKDAVDGVVALLGNIAQEKDVKIKTDVKENLIISGSHHRIRQMFINLVENGIKYNRAGGSVSISAYKDDKNVYIKISDTGIGIDKEHLNRIFERFYRVDKGRSRSQGGNGLGLSLVKHIVSLYGGSISVSSRINEGTIFTIVFPTVLD